MNNSPKTQHLVFDFNLVQIFCVGFDKPWPTCHRGFHFLTKRTQVCAYAEVRQRPDQNSDFGSSVVVRKKAPTYTHCWHECPLCHRAWFHQICNRSNSAPDKYLLKCAGCESLNRWQPLI